MSTAKVRQRLKKHVDDLPEARLELAEGILVLLAARGKDETFEAYLKNRPPFAERMEQAKRDVREGRGHNWRSIRRDV